MPYQSLVNALLEFYKVSECAHALMYILQYNSVVLMVRWQPDAVPIARYITNPIGLSMIFKLK